MTCLCWVYKVSDYFFLEIIYLLTSQECLAYRLWTIKDDNRRIICVDVRILLWLYGPAIIQWLRVSVAIDQLTPPHKMPQHN